MAQDLTRMRSRLYPENTPPLDARQIAQYKPAISPEWETVDNSKLRRRFAWDSFKEAVFFFNAVAYLAERENHHPDLTVSYKRVTVELTTHDVGGLSLNDFIVAAKIDKLVESAEEGSQPPE